MDNRRAGGLAGDSSSDEDADVSPPKKVLTQEEQWKKFNWNSPANADKPRTPAEKTVAKDNKFATVKSFLMGHGVSELEFQRVFELPEEKQHQGPRINAYHADALVVCENLASLRRNFLVKKYQKETNQTRKDMNNLLLDIEDHEMLLKDILAKVKKAGGDALDWPEVFKIPVTSVGKKK